jgi:adenine phosphoribosyltransferase
MTSAVMTCRKRPAPVEENRHDARLENDLKASIRTIPDYPKPGIMFRDITTLLGNPRAFRRAIDELVQPWAGSKIDKIAGIEARGFIIGGAVAHQLSAGFIPIRKKGKLPLQDACASPIARIRPRRDGDARRRGGEGRAVILVDDLIATGGTAEGASKLLRQMGAEVSPPVSWSTCRTSAGRQAAQHGRDRAHADDLRGALSERSGGLAPVLRLLLRRGRKPRRRSEGRRRKCPATTGHDRRR